LNLTCHPTSGPPPLIRPAASAREWMDQTPERFAKRCLPMTVANSHGWELLCPRGFAAVWTGETAPAGVRIHPDDEPASGFVGGGHFGCGVLTLPVTGLFRTDPGIDLWVTGPPNTVKDGIVPLTGLVETDWAVSTFTMNWKFTRAWCPIRFEVGEPYCFVFPIPRGLLESVEPRIEPMSDDLSSAFQAWSQSRATFNRDLAAGNAAGWQKDYHQGMPEAPVDHRTRVKARPFVGAAD
jgi:hypothetical protein